MIATVGVIIIILLCVAYFYLKCSSLESFATVISAVFAVITALSYYEPLANFLLARGYLGQWAHTGCCLLLFVFTFAIIRTLTDYLIGANINFGVLPTRVTAIVCGAIVGVLVSGTLLIAVAMTPLSSKWPYNRFHGREQSITAANINPDKSFLNTDGLVAGLFGWISKGSLSSKRSFDVYHADFIDQIHLNRLKPDEKKVEPKPTTTRRPARPSYTSSKIEEKKPIIVAAADAITVPRNGVQIRQDDNRTVVKMGIKVKQIADGGAADENGKVSFTLSQVSLICKETGQAADTTGTGKAIYPDKYIINPEEKNTDQTFLSELITFSRMDFAGSDKIAWINIAFNVPNRMTGVLLRFKQNATAKLPKPTTGD